MCMCPGFPVRLAAMLEILNDERNDEPGVDAGPVATVEVALADNVP